MVVATDLTSGPSACAPANGVEAYSRRPVRSLAGPLRRRRRRCGRVVPYVPTPALALLPHDTLTFESPLSYDGGPDGTDPPPARPGREPAFLRPGRHILLELGGEQAGELAPDLARLGYVDVALLLDDDGDARGIEATAGSETDGRAPPVIGRVKCGS